jgi:hypothetical protein
MAAMGDTPDTDPKNIVTELNGLDGSNVDIVRSWGKTVIACRFRSMRWRRGGARQAKTINVT